MSHQLSSRLRVVSKFSLCIEFGSWGVKECLVYLCQSHFCHHKIFIHKKQNHPSRKNLEIYTKLVHWCHYGYSKLDRNAPKKGLEDRRKFLLDIESGLAAPGRKLNFLIAMHFCYSNLTLQLPVLPPFKAVVVWRLMSNHLLLQFFSFASLFWLIWLYCLVWFAWLCEFDWSSCCLCVQYSRAGW